jgi:hypothetical protein
MTRAYNDRAQDEAKEIAALNRSIFRPNFQWNKSAKRDAEERRILDRHHDEREQRESNRRDVYTSRERVEGAFKAASQASAAKQRDDQYAATAAKYGQGSSKLAGRGRYQFEADEEDEQMEQELDENLNEIGDLSKRLNLLARAAGDEVRSQNVKLNQLSEKTDMYVLGVLYRYHSLSLQHRHEDLQQHSAARQDQVAGLFAGGHCITSVLILASVISIASCLAR